MERNTSPTSRTRGQKRLFFAHHRLGTRYFTRGCLPKVLVVQAGKITTRRSKSHCSRMGTLRWKMRTPICCRSSACGSIKCRCASRANGVLAGLDASCSVSYRAGSQTARPTQSYVAAATAPTNQCIKTEPKCTKIVRETRRFVVTTFWCF